MRTTTGSSPCCGAGSCRPKSDALYEATRPHGGYTVRWLGSYGRGRRRGETDNGLTRPNHVLRSMRAWGVVGFQQKTGRSRIGAGHARRAGSVSRPLERGRWRTKTAEGRRQRRTCRPRLTRRGAIGLPVTGGLGVESAGHAPRRITLLTPEGSTETRSPNNGFQPTPLGVTAKRRG